MLQTNFKIVLLLSGSSSHKVVRIVFSPFACVVLFYIFQGFNILILSAHFVPRTPLVGIAVHCFVSVLLFIGVHTHICWHYLAATKFPRDFV